MRCSTSSRCRLWCLSLSVAWQAYVQDANHLYITAAIAFAFKAVIIPLALHRIIAQLGIQRDVENVVGVGPTMLAASRWSRSPRS